MAHRPAIETIRASGDHLLRLINEVLDLSKIEAGRLEAHPADFDLRGLLEGLGAMFSLRCREQGLEWRLEGAGLAGWVHGDEAKLGQVLMNLLGNAVKFTRQGEVVLSLVPQAEGRCLFAVSDTGMGISPDEQARLFEPFHQGQAGQQQGGIGLGLAIARRLVELMGGILEVEVALASSGPEALEAMRQELPDIALVDVRMPGMSGLEAARRIWEEWGRGRVKVVAVSASALAHEQQQYLEAGFDAFLDKPVRAEGVYACLAALLGVEYEWVKPVQEGAAPLDLAGISLSAELLQKLKNAAELASVTELERYLDEVERSGGGAGCLAAHLRALTQDFRMGEILAVLEKLRV